MATLARRSRFADFDKWHSYYTLPASIDARKVAGWTDTAVFRSKDDPNEVVIICEVDDLAKALAYAESDEVKERQRKTELLETEYYLPVS